MTNEQVLRAYVDAFNSADWDRMEMLFTEDTSIRGVLGWGGLDVALPIWRELHESMRMRLCVEEVITQGEKAAALLTETGSFVGPFRGLPGQSPSDKPYEIIAIEWFEFRDGRIARRWAARDSGSITRQVLA